MVWCYYYTKKTGGWGEGGEGNTASKHAREHEARPPQTQEEFRLDSNNFGFICDGIVSVDSYTKTPYALSWQFSKTYGRITNNYGSSWRKDVVNQCLEFALRLLEFVVRSCVALARTFCQRTHATLHCIMDTRRGRDPYTTYGNFHKHARQKAHAVAEDNRL